MPSDGSPNADWQAIYERGLALHRSGRLEEASRLYQEVLAGDPDHVETLHLLGVYCVQTGRLEDAARLIGQAVALRPDFVDAHGNLATALNSLRRHEDALAAADRAIALQPSHASAHGNRGQALQALGRPDEALASYDQAAGLNPTALAHFNRAAVLRELGRLDDAVAAYDQAVALKPDYAEAHRARGTTLAELGRRIEALAAHDRAVACNPAYAEGHWSRGVTLRDLGRPAEALESLDRAIALRPAYAEAHGARGNVLMDLMARDEALASYETATRLNPDYFEVWSNKVVALRELRRPDEALAAADRALAIRPDYSAGHSNRGAALYDLRRLDEALESYDRAISLQPDYAEALSNRGTVLFEMRRLPEALAAHEAALAAEPDYADAHHNQAMCRLALGDFARGWEQYEWRWRTAPYAPAVRDFAAPLWLGRESLQGRTILIHAEQGFGDALQFCRYTPAVAALGARVVLEVPGPLRRLMSRLDGVAQAIPRGETPPKIDFQVPMMSLPHALPGEGFGPQEAYLFADPTDVAAWAERLGPRTDLRVGLCWAGGTRPDQLVQDSFDKRRSLSLEAFAPLAGIQGVSFHSLQKGPPAEQLAEVVERGWAGPEILDLTAELADFADTAALVANLDLVITCDTAIAHLAGGLGKPVWILNRFDACWRWLDGREDTPWYPSGRLFNQPAPGDWANLIERVENALRRLVGH
jgi:tetratricopeptide (TPR) repeat protein